MSRGEPPVPAVRERRADDLPLLLPVLRRTHEDEGYPVRAAAVSADWLAPADALGAWVAVDGDRPVGHVALLPARGAQVPLWTAGADCTPERLAVVARLFTDRTVPGAGTALLARAADGARALDRVPVLEVEAASPARGFYLRRGWTEVGRVVQQWGHRTVESAALVAPDVTPAVAPGTPPR